MAAQKRSHILIVDDASTNRDLFARLLMRQQYTVTVASGGREALDLLRCRRFDLVLLDIMMPDVDGLEVLKTIRLQYSMTELPVIMVTALDESSQVTEALDMGANDYLTKPIDKSVLLARVRTQTSLAQTHQEVATLAHDVGQRNKLLLKLLGRYVTDEVSENLLESPETSRLGGNIQKVTILFADLRGFTHISENMSPDRVATMLNHYFGEMIEIIRKYRGTVDKLIGDGLMATFGAPRERARDAERALACAIEMQMAMSRVNALNVCDDLPQLTMGIGINTGDVMVGNIGSDKHASFSVIGSHVNLAARIQSFAQGNEILISESTCNEGGADVRVDEKLEIQPRGLDHPVVVYRLIGLGGKYRLGHCNLTSAPSSNTA